MKYKIYQKNKPFDPRRRHFLVAIEASSQEEALYNAAAQGDLDCVKVPENGFDGPVSDSIDELFDLDNVFVEEV